MQLALFNAFILVSAFMAFASFCTIGDMCVGAWLNKAQWDTKRFLSGMKWGIILYIFFLWLIGAVTIFPYLLSHFNIADINLTNLNAFSAYSVAAAFAVLSGKKLWNMGTNLYKISKLTDEPVPEGTE